MRLGIRTSCRLSGTSCPILLHHFIARHAYNNSNIKLWIYIRIQILWVQSDHRFLQKEFSDVTNDMRKLGKRFGEHCWIGRGSNLASWMRVLWPQRRLYKRIRFTNPYPRFRVNGFVGYAQEQWTRGYSQKICARFQHYD